LYNQRLSERRANSVLNYFKERGLNVKRFKSVGFGMEMPLNGNESDDDRQLNRRVEIKLVRKAVKTEL
jgi:OmpA-OmpF porin, OOP family